VPTLYQIAESDPPRLEDLLPEYLIGREPHAVDDLSLPFWYGLAPVAPS